MKQSLFERRFGRDPKEFNSAEELDAFVEQKIGHKLEVKSLYSDICSIRGAILPIKKLDADKIIDAALKK